MSFFLAFSLLLSAFAVNSFAAETVTYRLCTFKLISGSDKPNTFTPVSDDGKTVTKVLYNVSSDIKVTCYQQTNNLKIGSDYTLTYGVKNLSAVGSCHVSIFLSDSTTNLDNAVTVTEFDTSSCSLSYYNNFSVQFTYPEQFSGKSTYVVVMIVADKGICGFQVTDFVFTNNDKSEEKIDGILEWLSAVYHGIVGGEDSRGVQHDGLVQGIKNGISALGDRISAFFDNLGEKFGINIGSLGDRIRDFFSNFWENVSAGFEAIKDKIADIGEGIKVKFQEISDNFTEFFDKFKPRVYEEFLWYVGAISDSTGELTDRRKLSAYTSDVFYVSSGSEYILEVLPSVDDYFFRNIRIAKYDANGQYLGLSSYSTLESLSSFSFESGFNYRIVIQLNKSLGDLSPYDLSKLCNSFVKIYCDEGWINALIHAFMNGLKKLFIPAPGFFDEKIDQFLEVYEKHFGIFAQVTIYFTKAIQKVESVLSDTYAFVFPELSVTIQGKKYVFSEKRIVDVAQWLESGTWSAELYEMYRVCASALLVFCVLKYARKVEGVILGNAETVLSEDL